MTLIDVAEARAALPRPERCRAIRQHAEVSLGEMAQELGTSAVTVSRWERGSRKPGKRYLVDYVRLLQKLDAIGRGQVAQ